MGAFLRKYGVGTGADVYVPLVKRGVVDFAVSADWTPAAADVKLSIDGGAAVNIGTLPTAVTMGNTAMWKFVFADAELQGKTIAVTLADAATKAVEDQMFLIETYGHGSAMYPPDFSDAAALGLARLDAAVSSRSSHTPANVRTEMDANSTKLANLDVTVGSRLAAAGYTAPDNAGIASAASSAASAATSAASADSKGTAIQVKTDNLPADPASNTQVVTRAAPGDAMTLMAAYDAAKAAASQASVTALGTPMQAGAHVQLATTQDQYAPAKAGDAMTLTGGERDAIAAALLDLANGTETGETVRQTLRLMRAALLGMSDGFPAGPAHFRDKANTKNRITATVDADGNRSAVTTDAA